MHESDSARSLIDAAINNPKIAAAISVGATAYGGAGRLGMAQDYLSTATMAVGLVTGFCVMLVWLVKALHAMREYRVSGKEKISEESESLL